VRMSTKIEELSDMFKIHERKRKDVPMPIQGYMVRDSDFDNMTNGDGALLSANDNKLYMQIVGCLIWIAGVRMDITFATMYLSWYTKEPRVHHMVMGHYVMSYLYHSKDLPLVLGGDSKIQSTVYTDCSHATAKNMRSVVGHLGKIHPKAGAVTAKSRATDFVFPSVFEGELDSYSIGVKTSKRLVNICTELLLPIDPVRKMYADNEAMINFVKGEGVAKGVRHMALRAWYTREDYKLGDVDLEFMPGAIIPADKLTKLASKKDHRIFARQILGLDLIDFKYDDEM